MDTRSLLMGLTNAGVANSASNKGPSSAIELLRNSIKPITRTGLQDSRILVEIGMFNLGRGDQETLLNTGKVLVGAVSSTLDCKVMVIVCQDADDSSDLICGGWEDNTDRLQH